MTVAELLCLLRDLALLEPEQIKALESTSGADTAQQMLNQLTQRGWLTSYQARELAEGRGRLLVVGPYLLLEPLGSGGMGEVFKARQRHLGRIEAVKLIREDLLRHP